VLDELPQPALRLALDDDGHAQQALLTLPS